MNMLAETGVLPTNGWWMLLNATAFIPPYVLVPRFIMSLRRLYAYDQRGRREDEIDTAFGLNSVLGRGATVTSAIMFADAGHNEGEEEGEEICMEEREVCGPGSGSGSGA